MSLVSPTINDKNRIIPPELNVPPRLLLGPGPSNANPRVLQALAMSPVGHLDPYFLHLMDEVLTADSSRFWPADEYQVGSSPPSYDKQFVRDYLETVKSWDKRAPAPRLPAEVVERTAAKYREALARLTGEQIEGHAA